MTSKEKAKCIEALRTLRDDIRVRLHLAGMEAQQRWEKLDQEVERIAFKTEQVTAKALEDLTRRLRELRDSLAEGPSAKPQP